MYLCNFDLTGKVIYKNNDKDFIMVKSVVKKNNRVENLVLFLKGDRIKMLEKDKIYNLNISAYISSSKNDKASFTNYYLNAFSEYNKTSSYEQKEETTIKEEGEKIKKKISDYIKKTDNIFEE